MPEIFGVAFVAAVALLLVQTAYHFWNRRLYALGLLVGLAGTGVAALILTVLASD